MQEKRKKKKREKKRKKKKKKEKEKTLPLPKKREKKKSLVENSKRLTNKKNRAAKNKSWAIIVILLSLKERNSLNHFGPFFKKKLLFSPTLLIASCVQTNIRVNPKSPINLIWMDGWMDG